MAIDISLYKETKAEALACHFSQTQGVDYLSAIEGLSSYRGAMSMKGSHAEVFEVISTQDSL